MSESTRKEPFQNSPGNVGDRCSNCGDLILTTVHSCNRIPGPPAGPAPQLHFGGLLRVTAPELRHNYSYTDYCQACQGPTCEAGPQIPNTLRFPTQRIQDWTEDDMDQQLDRVIAALEACAALRVLELGDRGRMARQALREELKAALRGLLEGVR